MAASVYVIYWTRLSYVSTLSLKHFSVLPVGEQSARFISASYYYYYYYYTIWMSLVTGLFFLVLLLNQQWSPLLRLPASHFITFRIMCDVPSIADFFSESIECFPGIASKFFCKFLVSLPVAPVITGTIIHFRFHIRCISIHKLLWFSFVSTCFLHNISVCGYCHIYQCACFLFFVFNYYIWPICCNFSVCVYCLIPLIIIIIIINLHMPSIPQKVLWSG